MEEVFDYKQLAEYLKVEEKTIRYLQDVKRLPYFRVGREVRFIRSEIEKWAKQSTKWPQMLEVG